jgi:hypothetical protein
MDKKFYRHILPFVNDPTAYPIFQEYIAARIEQYRDSLEKMSSHDEVIKTQGRISELRRLQHLKEEVQQEAK